LTEIEKEHISNLVELGFWLKHFFRIWLQFSNTGAWCS